MDSFTTWSWSWVSRAKTFINTSNIQEQDHMINMNVVQKFYLHWFTTHIMHAYFTTHSMTFMWSGVDFTKPYDAYYLVTCKPIVTLRLVWTHRKVTTRCKLFLYKSPIPYWRTTRRKLCEIELRRIGCKIRILRRVVNVSEIVPWS